MKRMHRLARVITFSPKKARTPKKKMTSARTPKHENEQRRSKKVSRPHKAEMSDRCKDDAPQSPKRKAKAKHAEKAEASERHKEDVPQSPKRKAKAKHAKGDHHSHKKARSDENKSSRDDKPLEKKSKSFSKHDRHRSERDESARSVRGRAKTPARPSSFKEKKTERSKSRRTRCPPAYKQWLDETLRKGISSLQAEFQSVRSYTRPDFSQEAFQKFPLKNRYKDVICMDETRVKLTPDQTGDDYIHASHVKTDGQIEFICAQGPTDATTADFWRMVCEYDCRLIIMLCDVVEQGKTKCHQYWPRDPANMSLHGTVFVKFESSTSINIGDQQQATVTQLSAINMMKNVTTPVQHLCWTGWPDKSVPSSGRPVMSLIERAVELHADKPVLVHCSAGIGRTGTLVALYMCSDMLNRNQTLDISQVLRNLRNQRLHSVQTELQFIFIYQSLIEYYNEADGAPKPTEELATFLVDYRNLLQGVLKSA